MDQEELNQGIASYVSHLRNITAAFNEWTAQSGLPIEMDPTAAIENAERGYDIARIAPFWSRADDSGIVHESQLRTAIDCFVQLHEDQRRCGHVLGAMQSGKTTTSLALQWAGPVLYMLTGQRVYPFYLIGNQTSHEDQTKTELNRFLDYYGNIELRRTDGQAPGSEDAIFSRAPSLANYRGHVLRGALRDVFDVLEVEDIIHRRVGGNQSVREIADLCRRATEQGYRPLMMIDEPQYGASDRMVIGDDGADAIRVPCVLVQIFDHIEQELGTSRNDHWFIGLSATPFELNDLSRVWEVRQALTENYSGFNFFNGRPISPGVDITPPATMGMTGFSQSISVPFMSQVSMAAYGGTPAQFQRHALKINFREDQAAYQRQVETALRDSIYALLDRYQSDEGGPVGLCIRAFNNNTRTEEFIRRLNLDPARIEVLTYYGGAATGLSIKRMIAQRQRVNLPYIIFVTNRARMADAFPVQVRFFMDFAQKASDLNALLQGLLGRACGYGKRSTVVLSDANKNIIDAYVATNGGYVHKTSRHSVPVGGYRRGAPTSMIKLRLEMQDPVVQGFFQEINSQIVQPYASNGSTRLTPTRSTRRLGIRRGPILSIAQTMNLFEHIENPRARTVLFPQIPTGFHVARSTDQIRHGRSGVLLGYSLDDNGNCRYTFRWSSRDAGAQGGAAGRARGRRDAQGQHIEPTIYLEKYDPTTGEIINDHENPQHPGNWRAFMVTFPLREPVQELEVANVALPTDMCAYDDWMTDEEKSLRDVG